MVQNTVESTDVSLVVSCSTFDSIAMELESLGLGKRNKIGKLLERTKGDVETVKAFLKAKKRMHDCLLRNRPSKEERLKKKMEKKEEKMVKKLQKEAKKMSKDLDKEEKKAKKWADKEITKKWGNKEDELEMKEINETTTNQNHISNNLELIKFLDLAPNDSSWPSISRLYLDGNNMLFVLSCLRNLILKNHNLKSAELVLESIAKKFSELLQLKECVLMFDETNRIFKESEFSVASARPLFKSTDDAFVDIASKLSETAVFVTSDRELIQRIFNAGKDKVTFCKPKMWFQFLARLLGGFDVNSLNNVDSWYTDVWMPNEFTKLSISMGTSFNSEVAFIPGEKDKVFKKHQKDKKKDKKDKSFKKHHH